MEKPLVSVALLCYNHEKYIRQAIDSVLEQITNFDYEIIIGEDYSTDKSREVLREYEDKYPGKIRIIYNKKNLGLMNNYKNVTDQCLGKYICGCSGDDYWHNQTKLQKQVDFLENNLNYGVVHTECDVLYEKKNKKTASYHLGLDFKIYTEHIFEDLLIANTIIASTAMIRRSLFKKYISISSFQELGFSMEDYPMWLILSRHTKFGYIDESLVTYRVHDKSISHKPDKDTKFKFSNSVFDIKYYFINKYGCNKKTLTEINSNYYNFKLDEGFELRNKILAKTYYEKIKQLKQNCAINKLKLIGSTSYIAYFITKIIIKFYKKLLSIKFYKKR